MSVNIGTLLDSCRLITMFYSDSVIGVTTVGTGGLGGVMVRTLDV